MKHDQQGVMAFTAQMSVVHPELKSPVTWTGFTAIAHRCGIVVRLVTMSHPARLVRLGNTIGIQIKRAMDRTLQTRYGMHEMWHFWNDDIHEACIYADEETVRHPREDAADLFAWYVTSPARVFLERRGGTATIKKASELVPDLSPLTIIGTGAFHLKGVGESFCQAEYERICGQRRPDGYDVVVEARLVCENDNKHDPKAVLIEVEGRKVGYLSRAAAREHRMRYGRRTIICKARIVGGWDRGGGDAGHFGVRLDI
jgi:hypothetical protein